MRRALCDMLLGFEQTAMTYIEIGEWSLMQKAAQAVRTNVFVDEQGIAPQDEWDGDDAAALHAVLFNGNGDPLGNARLLQPSTGVAKIGRMAVLQSARGKGYGARLLQALVLEARRRNNNEVVLSAQRTAETFYSAQGFTAVGEPFDEVGIPHIKMRLVLTKL